MPCGAAFPPRLSYKFVQRNAHSCTQADKRACYFCTIASKQVCMQPYKMTCWIPLSGDASRRRRFHMRQKLAAKHVFLQYCWTSDADRAAKSSYSSTMHTAQLQVHFQGGMLCKHAGEEWPMAHGQAFGSDCPCLLLTDRSSSTSRFEATFDQS